MSKFSFQVIIDLLYYFFFHFEFWFFVTFQDHDKTLSLIKHSVVIVSTCALNKNKTTKFQQSVSTESSWIISLHTDFNSYVLKKTKFSNITVIHPRHKSNATTKSQPCCFFSEYASLRKKCPYSELFWSAFSRIRTEYGAIGVSLCIQSECGKMQTRTTRNTEFFHAVHVFKCSIINLKNAPFINIWRTVTDQQKFVDHKLRTWGFALNQI